VNFRISVPGLMSFGNGCFPAFFLLTLVSVFFAICLASTLFKNLGDWGTGVVGTEVVGYWLFHYSITPTIHDSSF
jgi:hypothetical protein